MFLFRKPVFGRSSISCGEVANTSNKILNYFGNTHAAYLHARGEIATKILVETIDCQKGEHILEIGFGTGATLALLASIHKETSFHGIETSGLMHQKAQSRLRFCGLSSSVMLHLAGNQVTLLFNDNFFDKVYVESVLAIQEGEEMALLLAEIRRVLKPGGTLVLNETIWLNTVSKSRISEINRFCKARFGIIQSSEDYPYPDNWKSLLECNNLEVGFIQRLDEIKPPSGFQPKSFRHRLSDFYTFYGKIKSRLNPALRKEYQNYERDMDIYPGTGSLWKGQSLRREITNERIADY